MTESQSFDRSYEEFCAMTYPAYPRSDSLRDWNSKLLTLDGYVAGYASQIKDESLRATEIPDLDRVWEYVRKLRASFEVLEGIDEDSDLIGGYRTYVTTLENLVYAMRVLAVGGLR